MTALFSDIIFGPIHSRRLGLSLGVNLLPQHAKICNFDCLYCECGSNSERMGSAPQRRFAISSEVVAALQQQLTEMAEAATPPDVITFAGNGEPTLHPEFEKIIEATIAVRDRYCPNAKVSVLSNATTLGRAEVVRALSLVDNPILKIDSAIESTAKLINRPHPNYSVTEVIEQMAAMSAAGGRPIVQTMFLRGDVDGVILDNTTDEEITAWMSALKRIAPRQVMIYSLDRDTPCSTLQKVELAELRTIAEHVELELGVECLAN